MKDDNVVQFTNRYESEIALAERAYDLILERMARGYLPRDIPAEGAIPKLIDAVGELLHFEALEADGRRIPHKEMQKSVTRLESAVYGLGDWPDIPRLLAMAPLVVALEELEIPWLATEFMGLLPDMTPETEAENADVRAAIGRVALTQLRLALASEYWDESFEAALRRLREEVIANPDDDQMEHTLKQAVIFHAINARITLLEAERKKMAANEPLPDDLVAALDDFASKVTPIDMVRWGLHLVLSDVLTADLAPEGTPPKHLVAATEAAIIREDDPDIDVDLKKLARWAGLNPKKLRALRDLVAPALEFTPEGCEEGREFFQEKRWRIDTGSTDLWPPRWTPAEDAADLPPYTADAARARIDELREVAWMIIDPVEALSFMTGAFRYGGSAPDAIDEELVPEIVEIWKTERIIDFGEIPDFEEDEEGDDE